MRPIAIALLLVAQGGSLVAGSRFQVPGSVSGRMHVRVAGILSEAQQAGLELGVAEVARAAALLGAKVTSSPSSTSFDVGIVVGGNVNMPQTRTPTIYLEPRPGAVTRCEFLIRSAPSDITWHPSLSRFGASELNERFENRFRRGMTTDAWNAWFAVKALVESALRAVEDADLCEALLRSRFDGHKGVALSFDPARRILRHPLYELGPDGRAREKK